MSVDAPKSMRMPTKEILEQRLREGGFLGITPQTDRFYAGLVERVAGRRITGRQLDLAWTDAHTTFGETLLPLHQVTDMDFCPAVETIAPSIAQQANLAREKRLRNQ